jgi:Flp pilus assembly protein CpaB
MSNPTVHHRRELGIVRSRRPANLLLGAGVALLLVASFLVGRGGSDDPPADAVATTTSMVVVDSAPEAGAARLASVTVPDGHDGVAITLPFTAAGGGYVAAGDLVDVHAVRPGESPAASRVLLSRVLVLDVSTQVQARVSSGASERPSTSQLTYLLAVPRDEVDALVAATQGEGLYVSLLATSEQKVRGADSTESTTVDTGDEG